jgi:hypothetical protein
MKNRSGAPLFRVLPNASRPAATLPIPATERAGGGPGEVTARSLGRRLALALHDLGLEVVLPPGWVSVDGAAVPFGALDVPTADDLVRHLEDLVARVAESAAVTAAARRAPGAGQAALFGAGR